MGRLTARFLLALVLCASIPRTAPAESQGELIDWVVAKVNDEAITRSALELELVRRGRPLDDRQIQRQTLDALIDEHLFLLKAREFVIVRDSQVAQAFEQRRLEMDALRSRGLAVEDLRERLRDELMVAEFVERVFAPKIGVIEDSEIRQQFKERREQFDSPEHYRLDSIRVSPPLQATAEQNAEALAHIEAIRAGLEAGTTSIEAVASEAESDGAIALTRPDPDEWVASDRLLPELRRPVSQLETGEWSAPITTPLGFHIVRVVAKRTAQRAVLNDATRERVLLTIQSERLQRLMQTWLDEQQEKADIRVLDPALAMGRSDDEEIPSPQHRKQTN